MPVTEAGIRSNTEPGSSQVSISGPEFELFRKWLYANAGIQLADAKRALVAGRLSKRLRELNLTSFRAYYEVLSGNTLAATTERQLALDLLTTNETFFFRESAHFDYVREVLIPQWKGQSIRCWSAASSTGEEAYTLAMVLAAHHRGSWQITGTDISSRVVDAAQQAIYPLSRSQNIPESYLKRFCLKGTGERANAFRIGPEIRANVQFTTTNLQHPQHSLGNFDLVFLRNVMIYFDSAVKTQVVDRVSDRLKPGGSLSFGHAVSLNGIEHQLEPVKPAIYRKPGSA